MTAIRVSNVVLPRSRGGVFIHDLIHQNIETLVFKQEENQVNVIFEFVWRELKLDLWSKT